MISQLHMVSLLSIAMLWRLYLVWRSQQAIERGLKETQVKLDDVLEQLDAMNKNLW